MLNFNEVVSYFVFPAHIRYDILTSLIAQTCNNSLLERTDERHEHSYPAIAWRVALRCGLRLWSCVTALHGAVVRRDMGYVVLCDCMVWCCKCTGYLYWEVTWGAWSCVTAWYGVVHCNEWWFLKGKVYKDFSIRFIPRCQAEVTSTAAWLNTIHFPFFKTNNLITIEMI